MGFGDRPGGQNVHAVYLLYFFTYAYIHMYVAPPTGLFVALIVCHVLVLQSVRVLFSLESASTFFSGGGGLVSVRITLIEVISLRSNRSLSRLSVVAVVTSWM